MRRLLGAATAAFGIAALVFAGAPAAVAATLPSTDAIYVLPCDDEAFNGLLYRIDPTTGVATQVPTTWVNEDPGTYACAGPGAYNPVNGLGYWIAWGGHNNSEGFLIAIDLATGVNAVVGEFTLEGADLYTPIAIAIDGEGNAWATSWDVTPDVLYSLDLATAALTEVGPTGVLPESDNFGLGWDPVTDAIYGYNYAGRDFYSVDTATGAFELLNDDIFPAFSPYAIHFDSAGQVWGINGDIVSAPLADLDDAEVLEVTNPYPDFPAENIYSESIIIAPAPAPVLPATGADSAASAVLAGGGALMVLLGAAIALRRRVA